MCCILMSFESMPLGMLRRRVGSKPIVVEDTILFAVDLQMRQLGVLDQSNGEGINTTAADAEDAVSAYVAGVFSLEAVSEAAKTLDRLVVGGRRWKMGSRKKVKPALSRRAQTEREARRLFLALLALRREEAMQQRQRRLVFQARSEDAHYFVDLKPSEKKNY